MGLIKFIYCTLKVRWTTSTRATDGASGRQETREGQGMQACFLLKLQFAIGRGERYNQFAKVLLYISTSVVTAGPTQ